MSFFTTPRRKSSVTLFTAAAAAIAASSAHGQTVPAAQGRIWNSTFAGEFNTGPSDLAGWTYDIGTGQNGWGNNELQSYTSSPNNSFVNNGALTIRAIGTQAGPNVNYTSARIRTTNLFTQTYGLFEFRAKMPAGNGLWPALWMMPKDSAYGGWPTSGEIDIFEGKGQDTGWASGALHSGPAWDQLNTQTRTFAQSGLRPSGFTTTDWHTYSLKWDDGPGTAAGTMTFYIDGVAYHTRTGGWTVPGGQPGSAPFDRSFYIIMNMAVGGNFVGGNVHPGAGSYDMQIDYARSYTSALRPTWKNNLSGNWSDATKWTDSIVPNSLDANVLFGNAILQARTVTVDAPITVGKLTFDNANSYTIDGAQTVTLNTAGAPATIDVVTGSHTISAPVSLQKNTSLTVGPPASVLTMSGGITGAAGTTLTASGLGTVQTKHVRGGSVAVNAGTMKILPANGNDGASKIESLAIAAGATLDLTDSGLAIDYDGASPRDAVRDQILLGRAGGAWDGTGLTSALAAAIAANPGEPHKTALGYAEASALGLDTFLDLDVDETALLVRYTLLGDANLDGNVNVNDFTRLASNFGTSGKHWDQGDFNYDGLVNVSDFSLLANNFGLTLADTSLMSSVPEPGGISLLALAGVFTKRFRRRQ